MAPPLPQTLRSRLAADAEHLITLAAELWGIDPLIICNKEMTSPKTATARSAVMLVLYARGFTREECGRPFRLQKNSVSSCASKITKRRALDAELDAKITHFETSF